MILAPWIELQNGYVGAKGQPTFSTTEIGVLYREMYRLEEERLYGYLRVSRQGISDGGGPHENALFQLAMPAAVKVERAPDSSDKRLMLMITQEAAL